MEIYVVQAGDTLNAIAQRSGLSAERIASENRLFPPYELVVGQTLVLRFPDQVYTARSGDTLYSVARASGVPVRQLYRNNTVLEGSPTLYSGQTVVLSYQGDSAKYPPLRSTAMPTPLLIRACCGVPFPSSPISRPLPMASSRTARWCRWRTRRSSPRPAMWGPEL